MKIIKTLAVICLGLLTPLCMYLVKTRAESPLFTYLSIGIGLLLVILSVTILIDKSIHNKPEDAEVI